MSMQTAPARTLNDEMLSVEFYAKQTLNLRETRETGEDVYNTVEMVRIRKPGDNKGDHHARAHDMHFLHAAGGQITYAERFADEYASFRRGHGSASTNRTPLDVLLEDGVLSPSRITELQRFNVVSVEQLAGLPDRSLRRFGMWGRRAMDAAQEYLATAGGRSQIETLMAEMVELKAKLASQTLEPVAANVAADPEPIVEDEGIPEGDPYPEMTDDAMKTAIKEMGGDLPRGRASRSKLIEVLEQAAAS